MDCECSRQYFTWSTDLIFLLEAWHLSSTAWYVVTCVILFVIGIVHEWLTTFREGFEQKRRLEIASHGGLWENGSHVAQFGMRENWHFGLATVLHVLQLVFTCTLLLAVVVCVHILCSWRLFVVVVVGCNLGMAYKSYNVGLAAAAIGGLGVGHFFFARLRTANIAYSYGSDSPSTTMDGMSLG
eukprot:TRINITY_DN1579_c3_g1_i3.p1 TRINITY_DN1579_c3_g1~~TRINITY_DN1579_c3_g1_i3.p1  ORF type:complete len:198 (+),score=7.08 TRINITY_DN1579_c3_g1_i3:44-595(+)